MPARRVLTATFTGFALLALVLGTIGLFGIFAHDIASRVWVIDRGTIVEDGPPAKVVNDPQTEVAKEFFGRLRR